MTLNKVQGQEADSLLFDTRNAPFAMGHTYVGFSRVRKASSIAIFCNQKDILHDAPTITNIIYPELLRGIETSYLHTPDVYDILNEEEKEQFKLPDAWTYTPSRNNAEQQAAALVRHSLQDRRNLYKLAMGDRSVRHWDNDEEADLEEYDNSQRLPKRRRVLSPSHDDEDEDDSVVSDSELQMLTAASLNAKIDVPKLIAQLNDRLYLMQLAVVNVPMDCHCLFHAVLRKMKQLGHPTAPTNVKEMRRAVGEAIRDRRHEFLEVGEDPQTSYIMNNPIANTVYINTPEVTFEDYLLRMTNGTEYGDDFAIRALCLLYNLTIRIVYAHSSTDHTIGSERGQISSDGSILLPLSITVGNLSDFHFVGTDPIQFPVPVTSVAYV
jgi:hypothetical protein